ncbi:peroxisomal biogenesis factor 3 [Neocloeon triangulifer]|uniref:peroxisomal biogenesis factor 3 n=1 Tax=Neocloeon triangulifer TaxID=2078957 RepID=UPI00286F8FF0|nr:peroxisomal biogenesis factor 3 [Neocloeon triangulifer]
MFRRIRNFVSRHPKKIATVALVAAGTLAWKYAKHRLVEWQQKESERMIEAARRQAHFEATMRTADGAIEALGMSIAQKICQCLDTDPVIAKLDANRDKKGPEWREAWTELKILVVSRAVALVYCESILTVLMRVHLAAVAGHLAQGASIGESHLQPCRHFASIGVAAVCSAVYDAVKKSEDVACLGLGHKLSLEKLEQVLWSVQNILAEADPLHDLPSLAASADVTDESAEVVSLHQEAAEVLRSTEVWGVTSSCVSRGLAFTVDQVASSYTGQQAAVPLAKIIPVLNKLSQRPNGHITFLSVLVTDEKLKSLAANVYEAFACQH